MNHDEVLHYRERWLMCVGIDEVHRPLDNGDDISASSFWEPVGTAPGRRNVAPGQEAVVVVPAEAERGLRRFGVPAHPVVRGRAWLCAAVLDAPEQFVLGRIGGIEPVPLAGERGADGRGAPGSRESPEPARNQDGGEK